MDRLKTKAKIKGAADIFSQENEQEFGWSTLEAVTLSDMTATTHV